VLSQASARVLNRLVRWDALHFIGVAQHGERYEQDRAWGWLYTTILKSAAKGSLYSCDVLVRFQLSMSLSFSYCSAIALGICCSACCFSPITCVSPPFHHTSISDHLRQPSWRGDMASVDCLCRVLLVHRLTSWNLSVSSLFRKFVRLLQLPGYDLCLETKT